MGAGLHFRAARDARFVPANGNFPTQWAPAPFDKLRCSYFSAENLTTAYSGELRCSRRKKKNGTRYAWIFLRITTQRVRVECAEEYFMNIKGFFLVPLGTENRS